MSYLPERLLTTPFKVDVLRQSNISTSYSPSRMIWTTVGTQVTSVSLSQGSTLLTFPAGASYYLEASIGGLNVSKNSTAQWQFYDTGNSAYIGQSANLCINVSHGYETLQGRRVARALILDSEINVTMSVALALRSSSGTTSYSCTATGINNQPIGVPTLRIIELPS
jgi:hypothetical protein